MGEGKDLDRKPEKAITCGTNTRALQGRSLIVTKVFGFRVSI